jgi:hypothetical protein
VRYEKEQPGELIHVDIKRLGRFDRVGHRITRRRSFGSPKQGFEFVYVATDDFTRLSYVDILADECSETASSFLIGAVAWFAQQNIRVERVMTDNGSAFLIAAVEAALRRPQDQAQAHSPDTLLARMERPNASSRHCSANGPTASNTTPQPNANDGSHRTCTSTTTIERIPRSLIIHQSVAWIGTTS